MIHIRIDNEIENSAATFACGIVGVTGLPKGDVYFFAAESSARRADCPGCNPGGPQPFGTPISQLSGRPGEPGWERFKEIAASWGYD